MLKFKDIFNKILKADIVRVFSLTSVSTLVKMVTGFVSMKVVASIIGPAGVAMLGQLSNFTTIVLRFASGGINNGITKYVSEYKHKNNQLALYLSNALRIVSICSLVIGLTILVFHRGLSKIIMLSDEYGYVFIIFGITVLMYALNDMLLSILNGLKEFQRYVKISIANSIVGLVFTVFFVLKFGLKGALISMVTYQSVMLFVTIWMVRKLPWLTYEFFKEKISRPIVRQYFQFSIMTLVSTACVPVSQLLLRTNVISMLSVEQAGWWEGMNRISHMYLMVITSSFGVYYLPRLSEIKNKYGLKREILKSYAVVIPLLIVGFSIIYIFRHLIIRILFSPEFYPMEKLFIWQLMGDIFKISSWLLSFLMLAKAKTKLFVITEFSSSAIYLLLGFLLVKINGIIGLTQAYMINYILYTMIMFISFKDVLTAKK